jgi:hypothetical protein
MTHPPYKANHAIKSRVIKRDYCKTLTLEGMAKHNIIEATILNVF